MYYKTLITCFVLLISSFVQSYANGYEPNETELYEEAVKLFDQKKYKQAIRAFQKIEDLYPFSYIAMKARLLSGVSHYNMGDYTNAANDMDNYIQTYSNGEDLPYVYYLRVLSYYMQIHKVRLGQQAAYKTLDLATEYINFFPNSIYTEEVKGKVKLVTEHMLEKEYSIGRFYLRRGEYLAAIKRFQNVISNKDSNCFPKSIGYLITAHSALGLNLEVQQYESLLAENLNRKSGVPHKNSKSENLF
ncbi:outer membrane protein assembly factor BamD [Wolbachia endosymbiont of Dirofilaria (Dirofilaria) immitis]|uniref:outer membrane protein assembly factor BamD n=1 Tax=Wolbachia endosymbiont of Dirofilaria (Dirofilaria) immitis TaxID=1812115 RepID=UPI00158B9109|nr:outer membrane protein assembly factor BamD [Wolbachia endosymbiont of Dirofilaria (Dirofilaria) immitis]QKX02227.1 outer membrane protein assembly factor BamD [Wolbachia endosymbiont of Dirofilaria (Dirofilaria) immitis]